MFPRLLKLCICWMAVAGWCCVFLPAAQAGVWFGTGVSPVNGDPLSASAEFELSGSTLTIKLTNTSAQASGFVPSDGLSALYFNVLNSPSLALTTAGANAPTASKIWNGSSFSGPVILSTFPSPGASESPPYWSLAQSAAALAATVPQHYGVGSAGLGIFGPGVGGLGFTIFPNGFNGSNGNSAVDTGPVAVDRTTLTITGFTGSLADISDVTFQYGTALDEGTITTRQVESTPEPASFVAWGLLTAFGATLAWMRRHRAA